jgi:hypothetical protein
MSIVEQKRRLQRSIRLLAESLAEADCSVTAERLFELGLQIIADPHPATIREIRLEILGWQGEIVDGMYGLIIPDDLTGVLGQLRELQHDLEG